jgi:hypothetical protein
VDGYVLAAGIVTSSLSLGAGIWQSVKGSSLRSAPQENANASSGPGALKAVRDNLEGKSADAVVVNGEVRPLTIEQRDAVLHVLGQRPAV